MPQPQDRLRDRLKGLMAIRVVLVTIFLGSAMAVDLTAFAGVSDTRNSTLLALIVATYLLTIIYGFALRKNIATTGLAYAQIAGDMLLTTALVLVTGGFDSLFLFFFHLTIINAAVVTGRRFAAFTTASATTLCLIYFAILTMEWLPHPIIDDVTWPHSGPAHLLYEVTVHSLAGFLIAFLAGHLATRLGQATVELEQRESDIQELRALNENILTSLSSGLLTIDKADRIIFFNRAAEEITGFQAHHILGKPLHQLFPTLAATTSQTAINSLDTRYESPFERLDGRKLYLGFSTSTLRDSQNQEAGQIIVFQDLSEIRKLEAQMKRSERLAAIGTLAAAIAHEIRNPLASISGSVEMLSQDEATSDDNRLLMNIVVREVDRLNTLIRDFLAYSQPRPLQLQAHKLLPIIQDVEQLFRAQAHRSKLELQLIAPTKTDLTAQIDPEAFRQILWNLLQNAADAVAPLPKERRQIRLELIPPKQDSSIITLAIEDDGPGIPPETKERLFEPFFTTKDTGTGLGLATIFRLIEEQHGYITLEPPHHLSGARFEVSLPLKEAAKGSGAAKDAKTAKV